MSPHEDLKYVSEMEEDLPKMKMNEIGTKEKEKCMKYNRNLETDVIGMEKHVLEIKLRKRGEKSM